MDQDTLEMEAHLRFLNMDLEMEVLDLESCLSGGEEVGGRDSIELSGCGSRMSLRAELEKARQTKPEQPRRSTPRRASLKSPQPEAPNNDSSEAEEEPEFRCVRFTFPEPFEASEERMLLRDETDFAETSTRCDQGESKRKRKFSEAEVQSGKQKKPGLKADAQTPGDGCHAGGSNRGSDESPRLETNTAAQKPSMIDEEKVEDVGDKVENTPAEAPAVAPDAPMESKRTPEQRSQRRPETRSARKRLREQLDEASEDEVMERRVSRKLLRRKKKAKLGAENGKSEGVPGNERPGDEVGEPNRSAGIENGELESGEEDSSSMPPRKRSRGRGGRRKKTGPSSQSQGRSEAGGNPEPKDGVEHEEKNSVEERELDLEPTEKVAPSVACLPDAAGTSGLNEEAEAQRLERDPESEATGLNEEAEAETQNLESNPGAQQVSEMKPGSLGAEVEPDQSLDKRAQTLESEIKPGTDTEIGKAETLESEIKPGTDTEIIALGSEIKPGTDTEIREAETLGSEIKPGTSLERKAETLEPEIKQGTSLEKEGEAQTQVAPESKSEKEIESDRADVMRVASPSAAARNAEEALSGMPQSSAVVPRNSRIKRKRGEALNE